MWSKPNQGVSIDHPAEDQDNDGEKVRRKRGISLSLNLEQGTCTQETLCIGEGLERLRSI